MSIENKQHIETINNSAINNSLDNLSNSPLIQLKKQTLGLLAIAWIVVCSNSLFVNKAQAIHPVSPKQTQRIELNIKQSGTVIHTVQKGDTLYSLASKYNTTVPQLKKWNWLGVSNNINTDQSLIIAQKEIEWPKIKQSLKKATFKNSPTQINDQPQIFDLSNNGPKPIKTVSNRAFGPQASSVISGTPSSKPNFWGNIRTKIANLWGDEKDNPQEICSEKPTTNSKEQNETLEKNPFIKKIENTVTFALNSEKNPIYVNQASSRTLEKTLKETLQKMQEFPSEAEQRNFLLAELEVTIDFHGLIHLLVNGQRERDGQSGIKEIDKDLATLAKQVAEANQKGQNSEYATGLSQKLEKRKTELEQKLAYAKSRFQDTDWEKMDFKVNKYTPLPELFDQLATVFRIHNARGYVSTLNWSDFFDNHVAEFGLDRVKIALRHTQNHVLNQKVALQLKWYVEQKFKEYLPQAPEMILKLVRGLPGAEWVYNLFSKSFSDVVSITQTTEPIFGGKNKVAKHLKVHYIFDKYTNPYNPQENIDRSIAYLTLCYKFARGYQEYGDIHKIAFSAYSRGRKKVKDTIAAHGINWHQNLDTEGQGYFDKVVSSGERVEELYERNES